MIYISQKYTDLLETKFPNEIDDFKRYRDAAIDELTLINTYIGFYDSGEIDKATEILEQNPSLKEVIINAQSMNQTRDAVIALQRFYLEDVQKYLVNLVEHKGEYSPFVSYTKYNVVTYVYNQAVQSYMGIQTSIPVGTLPTNPSYFIPITLQGPQGASGTGLAYRGVYSSIVQYKKDDCVTYENILWAATVDNMGEIPDESSSVWSVAIDIVPKYNLVYDETSFSNTIRTVIIPGVASWDDILNIPISIRANAYGINSETTLRINDLNFEKLWFPSMSNYIDWPSGAPEQGSTLTIVPQHLWVRTYGIYQVVWDGNRLVVLNPQIGMATLHYPGIVQLSDSVFSESSMEAATSNAVKIAYDKAISAARTKNWTSEVSPK